MRLYRVAWVDPDWPDLNPWEPFHPLFVPLDRQGGGRFDNPDHYAALYASATSEGAVGETFGNYATWLAAELVRAKQGRPRCLVTLEVPDDVKLVDLDDPEVLLSLGLRPTDVVRRNRDHTQRIALRLWLDHSANDHRGIRWWSYWRPEWVVTMLWSETTGPPSFKDAEVVEVEEIAADHAAVVHAAESLPRYLPRKKAVPRS